ncbi:MAG TPA: carbohydrate kinase [Ktedonobacteraceae bacterium]|jgi:fructokinase|nr:carbohydrate kinase [Ktedonobacteraceae bacterium]
MKHIINLGEALIDIIPSSPIRLGEACYTPHAGGAIANAAVAIARLGGSSRFIGGISEDRFGRLLVQTLVENAVDIRYVQFIEQAPTAVALVTLLDDGQRRFTFFREGTADSLLQVEELNWSAWQDTAICHTGGVLLSSGPARIATLAAMEHTRRVGAIVSFDVNVRKSLWDSPSTIREIIAKGVERADILKLSVDEAEFVSDQVTEPANPPDSSWLTTLGEMLLGRGPRLVIITLGANGALLMTASQRVEIRPLSVRPVDTTGAGDAFIGAVLYTLLQQGCSTPSDLQALTEQELSTTGNFANAVAGISVTRYGGISSFPYLHEVNGFSAT